jgi:membrane protein DedA with SNARE-associated domain
MFGIPLVQLFQWLLNYRYAILMPVMIFEGPIATVIAGFLVAGGYMNMFVVLGMAIMGDFIGDIGYYAIGHFGRQRFLRNGTFLKINKERMALLEDHYRNHPVKTFLFGKWTQSAGFAVLIAAGLASFPFGRFVFWNVLGSLPKIVLFAVVGYYFGENYAMIDRMLKDIGIGITVLLIVSIGIFYFYRKYKKNRT